MGFDKTLTPYHLLAYLLDNHTNPDHPELSADQENEARDLVQAILGSSAQRAMVSYECEDS